MEEKHMKMDRKLLSSKQRYEPQYIAQLFNCHVWEVDEAAIAANPRHNGKPTRSRPLIYKELLLKGKQPDFKKLASDLLGIPATTEEKTL